ncbi:MAG: lytic transglycosylase domain-containing protein [Pseudomonadota bacterium]
MTLFKAFLLSSRAPNLFQLTLAFAAVGSLALSADIGFARSVPLPQAKPAIVTITHSGNHHAQKRQTQNVSALKGFFDALKTGNASNVLAAQNRLQNPVDKAIAHWVIATSHSVPFSHNTLTRAASQVPGWPGAQLMTRAREEVAIRESQPSFLPSKPETVDGMILKIEGLLKAGAKREAKTALRHYWTTRNLDQQTEARILGSFGRLLSQADHTKRADRLLYLDRASGALRLKRYLSKDQQALLDARVAVIRRQANAGRLFASLPASAQKKAGYHFAKVQNLRRADKWLEAARALQAAPQNGSALTVPKQWWIERRLVSRKVLEAGYPSLAYDLVTKTDGFGVVEQVDAAFHAGWYALRFMGRADIALTHFETIERLAKRPLSKSRGLYWTARAQDALGRTSDARRSFTHAASLPQTYYGQLALRHLGQTSISLPPLPSTDRAQASFNNRPFVQVIKRLLAVGQPTRAGLFYRHLARTLTDPAEITLLARLAEDQGSHTMALQVGKIAVGRGVPVTRLAFPLGAIPANARISKERTALAYAIARQESAFNIAAVSRADARGLMQLLPETAKRTARSIGLPFHPRKLTRDGAYNATLGSAFLGQLIDRFAGSYVLAFAGYNAGPGRSDQWIKRFGDPRRANIDAVDWIEAIPFAETRNYVQRVMENYQVYRHRLENAPLTIVRDLNRGTPS